MKRNATIREKAGAGQHISDSVEESAASASESASAAEGASGGSATAAGGRRQSQRQEAIDFTSGAERFAHRVRARLEELDASGEWRDAERKRIRSKMRVLTHC